MSNIFSKDLILFKIGIFFLPSAFSISSIFIFLSIAIQSFKRRNIFLKEKINFLLILLSSLMILSSFINTFLKDSYFGIEIPSYYYWIGLLNWIPFFWIFWASQGFLKTSNNRKSICDILCFSTIPVIVSGIGQNFFNWIGPLEFLNGLVIWYQRPIDEISGLTGLFNHANYAGSWLNLILPLCIAQLCDSSKNRKRFIFFSLILIGILTCIFLTNSRNAWGCAILSIPLVLGISSLRWFLPFTLFLISLITVTSNKIFKGGIQNTLRTILPNKVWLEFTNEGFTTLDVTRLEILNSAKKIIIDNPFVGTGAGSFPVIYEFQTGFWKGHSHNIFAEFAINNGIPSTILFVIFLLYILCISFKSIFKRLSNNIIDKAIWSGTLIFLSSQLIDIQYLDGRISLIFWLFLAALKCTIDENKVILNE